MPSTHPAHKPNWWPETEPWPPRRGRARGWWWRWLFIPFFFFILISSACTVAFWLTIIGLGWPDEPRPFGPGGPHVMPWMIPGVGRLAGPLLAGIIVLSVVTLVAFSVRRVATPVRDLMEAAERVEAGDYGVRVAERGPRDLRGLTRAFNAMTARLQANDVQRRRLLADVTHELRTPLAVLQGNLEAMLDGVYARDDAHLTSVLEETRVLARLIEDLRTLSLAESGILPLQREPTDLGILITESLATFEAQARAVHVQLNGEIAEDLPLLEIDPVRVREVLTNLIANALRYAPAHSAITVRAALEATAVQISVQDKGPGLSPEALPQVFDRFYKAEDSPGSGLGLAIAKSLVNAHGGEMTVESQPGRGAIFRFTLPWEANGLTPAQKSEQRPHAD